MSSLTILSVAYPFAPVGQDAAGGAEQVLAEIDRALTCRGHRSLVIACEGSKVAGTLIATRQPPALLDDAAWRAMHDAVRAALADVLAHGRIDLVHMHGLDFFEYLPRAGVPVLVTLHLPALWLDHRAFRVTRPQTFFQCVSRSQQHDMVKRIPVTAVIENGVRTSAFPLTMARRRFALAIGRVCPEKGLHLAIEAARYADVPLLVAGPVFSYPAHERYFHTQFLSRVDARRRYIGPIGYRRKRRLMNAAQCVVIPSVAPETSSLVAMEALACGTPVVAFPSGALADIVEHGVTGFLVRTIAEMADAIVAARDLSRETCREIARQRFSAERMTARYLDLYAQVIEAEEHVPVGVAAFRSP